MTLASPQEHVQVLPSSAARGPGSSEHPEPGGESGRLGEAAGSRWGQGGTRQACRLPRKVRGARNSGLASQKDTEVAVEGLLQAGSGEV